VSASKKNVPRKRTGVILLADMARKDPGFERARQHPEWLPLERLKPGARKELERYLADPYKATAEDLRGLYDQGARMRKGGKTGRRSGKVKQLHAYIRELLIKWPTWPHERLYEKAVKTEIRKLSKPRFDGHVRTVISEGASRK
jgi:hypothetical protein